MAKMIFALLLSVLCFSCSELTSKDSETLRPLTAPVDPCEDERPNDMYVIPYSDTLLMMLSGRDLWYVYNDWLRYSDYSYNHFRKSFFYEDNKRQRQVVIDKGKVILDTLKKELFIEYTKDSRGFVNKYLIESTSPAGFRLNVDVNDLPTLAYILNIMGYRIRQDHMSGYYYARMGKNFEILNSPSPYAIIIPN